jgi:hypothetical protein
MLAEIEQLQPGRKSFFDPFFSDAGGSFICERLAMLGIIIDEEDV